MSEQECAGRQGAMGMSRRTWQIVGWMFLGALLAVALAGAFFAYGQPELLLEQMNLRYCG